MKQIIKFFTFAGACFLLYHVSYAQDRPGDRAIEGSDTKVVFRVRWDGRVIPGISFVSELRRKTEVITHRRGGDPSLQRRSPGTTEYQPITIKRPRSDDREFEQWADKVWNLGAPVGSETSLKDFRKDISIELCDERGTVLLAYRVYRCWPSEYSALSALDEEDESLATECLILQHEGWERDYDIR